MELEQIIDLKPDEHPFYTKNEEIVKEEKDTTAIPLTKIPQGQGSQLDSDKVDGLEAVTADKAGPNTLVATDSTGKLPSGIIPASISTYPIMIAMLWGR